MDNKEIFHIIMCVLSFGTLCISDVEEIRPSLVTSIRSTDSGGRLKMEEMWFAKASALNYASIIILSPAVFWVTDLLFF